MKHEFAVYWDKIESLIHLPQNASVCLRDTDLLYRLTTVLRREPGQTFILFNRDHHVLLRLERRESKDMQCSVVEIATKNPVLKPLITLVLPLLKKEALEQALYAAVELGAHDVQLVLTEKVQRTWGGQKEMDRLERIMIAAAEQSKHFSFPLIHEPQPLSDVFDKLAQPILFFDQRGRPAYDVVSDLRAQQPQYLTLIVGPEGDLTDAEKESLARHGVVMCALTPTVLRAVQAVNVGLGLVRSMLR